MEIINIPLQSLVAYENNAKIHTEDQVNKLAKAITEFGFRVPILVKSMGFINDELKYEIVAGHGRVLAATQIGLESVPAHSVGDLTTQQVKALRIADNKLNESAWNKEVLAEEFGQLEDYFQELTAVELEDLGVDLPIEKISENREIVEDDLGDFVKCPQCGFHVTTN